MSSVFAFWTMSECDATFLTKSRPQFCLMTFCFACLKGLRANYVYVEFILGKNGNCAIYDLGAAHYIC